jgi:hypothetical protein
MSQVDMRGISFFFPPQTELTCQRIQEFETQASSDLELRNNKIDELNRVSIVVAVILLLLLLLLLILMLMSKVYLTFKCSVILSVRAWITQFAACP